MSEWIVKDNDCVPLPPYHVLRHGIDWLKFRDGRWERVGDSNGCTVGLLRDADSSFVGASCLAIDWPEELGPLPQKPEHRTSADDINELAVEDLQRENQQLREQCRRQADLIERLQAQTSKAFESIEE